MNTTILNDPEFHALPKGVRQMLLASESYFFDQPTATAEGSIAGAARQANPFLRRVWQAASAPVNAASFALLLRPSRRILAA